MTIRNARLHPNAVNPAGASTRYATIGALNLTVPEGASGIMMQQQVDKDGALFDDVIYWKFGKTSVPFTAGGTGFLLKSTSSVPFVFWFDPTSVTFINLWLNTADVSVQYQFVSTATGKQ